MSDALVIDGLRLATHVGVPAEERTEPQEVIVRLEVSRDMSGAEASDELEDTIDYAALLRSVEKTVTQGSFALLEHLAGRIADSVSAFDGVDGVTVEVAKAVPPVPQTVGRVAVRIER